MVLRLQEDIYNPHAKIQDLLWDSIHNVVEPLINQWPFSKLRERALDTVMQHIHYEDENSRYLCIGPVSKVLPSFSFFSFGLQEKEKKMANDVKVPLECLFRSILFY